MVDFTDVVTDLYSCLVQCASLNQSDKLLISIPSAVLWLFHLSNKAPSQTQTNDASIFPSDLPLEPHITRHLPEIFWVHPSDCYANQSSRWKDSWPHCAWAFARGSRKMGQALAASPTLWLMMLQFQKQRGFFKSSVAFRVAEQAYQLTWHDLMQSWFSKK